MCSNPISQPSPPPPPPPPPPPEPPQARRQPDGAGPDNGRLNRRRAAGTATPGQATVLGGSRQTAPGAFKTLLGQ